MMRQRGIENCRKTAVRAAVLGLVLLCTGCEKKIPEEEEQTTEEQTTEEQVVSTEETKASETIAPFPEKETEEAPEETGKEEIPTEPQDEDDDEDWDHTLIVGTDIHYLSRELTDGGENFQYMVEHGDGKVVTYIEQITDAFLEEVIKKQPDVLILSGDLTLDGELQSHMELAEKLYAVEEEGIPVLVIPGNHDINNIHASEYRGAERIPAKYTTPEDFWNIYQDFGYNEALSEDSKSLSYVYELDDNTWILMLDSCQYTPRAHVGGAIMSETYDWIEEQLSEAWDEGVNVIPVAHHNLLDESEVYVEDCTIEHGEQLAEQLEDWDISLFLSGHLHVQHAKQSSEGKGVWEIVTGSLATPACRYGVVKILDDGDFDYHTEQVDVQSWAKRHNRAEKELLNFNAFKEPFLRRVFYNQSYDVLGKDERLRTGLSDEFSLDLNDEKTREFIDSVTEEQRVKMSNLYSELNYHYYQGDTFLVREELEQDPNYQLWLDLGAGTVLCDYVEYIMYDAKRDYNHINRD